MRVRRQYLPYLAGGIWLTIGLGLMIRGFLWWQENFSLSLSFIYFLALVPLAFLFSSKILAKVVHRTLSHIQKLPERACMFAFQPAKSYGLMLIMISLGVLLRHSPLPQVYLGTLYLLMGLSLFLAGLNLIK